SGPLGTVRLRGRRAAAVELRRRRGLDRCAVAPQLHVVPSPARRLAAAGRMADWRAGNPPEERCGRTPLGGAMSLALALPSAARLERLGEPVNDARSQADILLRGAVDALPKGRLLEQLESGRPLRVKLGIDPTSADIHLGHCVVLSKLRAFQD